MAPKIQMRISPSMNHQRASISGAAHDRVGQGKVIRTPEIITLRTMPKIPITPSSLHSNMADHEDLEDNNYMPVSEEDVSLGDEDFIVPEEPLEQERFKRQLIATTQSMKEK